MQIFLEKTQKQRRIDFLNCRGHRVDFFFHILCSIALKICICTRVFWIVKSIPGIHFAKNKHHQSTPVRVLQFFVCYTGAPSGGVFFAKWIPGMVFRIQKTVGQYRYKFWIGWILRPKKPWYTNFQCNRTKFVEEKNDPVTLNE